MNLPTIFVRVTLAVLLAVVSVGCRKGDKTLTPIPNGTAGTGGGIGNTPGGGLMPGGGLGNEFGPGGGIDEGNGTNLPENADIFTGKNETPLPNQTVYFDFDSFVIKASELPKIERVAGMLKDDSTALLRVEGHCDERGTEEYNRTLGERRALAVRDALIREGISLSRINTQSWGEDQPAVEGQDEAAYSKNRRGEFTLLTP